MIRLAEWLLCLAAICLILRVAYRQARDADRQETEYERFRQRANRHRRRDVSGPGVL